MKNIFGFAAVLLFVATASAQTAPVRIRVVYDTTDANSSAMGPLLIQKFAAYPKLFILVKEGAKDMSVIADCYKETPSDPYSCFYTASKLHGVTQSFLGGAIVGLPPENWSS